MGHHACMRLFLLLIAMGTGVGAQALETRVYAFTNTAPARVEAQIREWVPEGPRVLLNAARGQVMVLADEGTHQRIAQWLRRVDLPPPRLMLRIRRDREWSGVEWPDGTPATLAVTFAPPAELVEEARARAAGVTDRTPVAASVLQVQVSVLRDDPPTARLKVTPAVVFGAEAPHVVAAFPELTTDVLLTSEGYLDLPQALSGHAFYARFFRAQPDPARPAAPVGLLLSLEGLRHEEAVQPLETLEP